MAGIYVHHIISKLSKETMDNILVTFALHEDSLLQNIHSAPSMLKCVYAIYYQVVEFSKCSSVGGIPVLHNRLWPPARQSDIYHVISHITVQICWLGISLDYLGTICSCKCQQ
jgi:hypothetical protein